MTRWLAVLVACSGEKPAGTDSGVEGDTDAEADSDTDTDTDTDSDSDSDTAVALDATGSWIGSCTGDIYGGGSGSTSTSPGGTFGMQVELVDTGGALEGTLSYSGYGYVVVGARTGSDLALFPTGYTGTSSPGSTFSAPVELRLALVADVLAGDLVYYPNQTHGLDTIAIPCTLAR